MQFLIVLILLVTLVLLGYLVKVNRRQTPDEPVVEDHHRPDTSCCGAHEVCEAETLLTLSDKILYYDDEELDAYSGIPADAYSASQTEEFRDILLTLQTHEVAGWLRSLTLRRIELPSDIREEALMIVGDFRDSRAKAAKSG